MALMKQQLYKIAGAILLLIITYWAIFARPDTLDTTNALKQLPISTSSPPPTVDQTEQSTDPPKNNDMTITPTPPPATEIDHLPAPQTNTTTNPPVTENSTPSQISTSVNPPATENSTTPQINISVPETTTNPPVTENITPSQISTPANPPATENSTTPQINISASTNLPVPENSTPQTNTSTIIDLSDPIYSTDQFFNESFENHRKKCAVFYLIRKNHIQRSVVGLRALFFNFNDYYKYPVLIFHQPNFNLTFGKYRKTGLTCLAKELYQRSLTGSQMALIEFIEFDFAPVPSDFNFTEERAKNNGTGVVWDFYFPGYQQMCTFMYKEIYDHPRISNLTYILRIDTDGHILSNVSLDFFQVLYNQKSIYGTRAHSNEGEEVTLKMGPVFLDYLKDFKPVNQRVIEDLQKNSFREQFYNNFEIIHIPSFSMPHIKHFYEAVNKTYNVFRYRWTDAPIRYYVTQFFFPEDKIFSFCGFDYNHAPRYFGIPDDCPKDTKGRVGVVRDTPMMPPGQMPRFNGADAASK